MLVIRVRECSTRHHVFKEVLGYHASTVRKLLMDAEHTYKHTKKEHLINKNTIKKWPVCTRVTDHASAALSEVWRQRDSVVCPDLG